MHMRLVLICGLMLAGHHVSVALGDPRPGLTPKPTLTPDESKTMREVGRLLRSDQREQAIALLKKNRGPEASAHFDYMLGKMHMTNRSQADGELKDAESALAVQAFTTAVKKHPGYRLAWRNLGLILMRQGEHVEAVAALNAAVMLEPEDGTALLMLGHIHAEEFSKAQADADAAELRGVVDVDNKALHRANRHYTLATLHYTNAEAITKHEADALMAHASLQVSVQKFDEALAMLQRAQAIKPRESTQKFIEQVQVMIREKEANDI
jgi:tetratricopeptide (TPR) repeat protein